MEIFGLPAHVLVVHAAVVLTPLAVLAAIVFAVHKPSRYLTRWPTLVLAIAATGAVWAARLTGEDLRQSLQLPQELIQTHQERGEQTALIMIAFLVLAVIGAFLLGGPSGLVSGRGARQEAVAWMDIAIRVGLVAVSVLALVWVIITGDAGARATWG